VDDFEWSECGIWSAKRCARQGLGRLRRHSVKDRRQKSSFNWEGQAVRAYERGDRDTFDHMARERKAVAPRIKKASKERTGMIN
jgi:hypothetical protein